jgi:ubiquinone/menaquinone biosynthesis C-methylase UbiE
MTWPKQVPVLSPEQTLAREQWMRLWHEVLPNRFGLIEKFNHGFPAKQFKKTGTRRPRTLEVGAGLGEHASWEDLSGQDYVMLEYREEWANELRARHPALTSIHGDIQTQLNAPPASFDRVVAIHVLEHLPDLPSALREIYRLLAPGGQFDIVIPCEGGWAYELARKVSSERMFKKHFGMEYKPIIQAEHLNTCDEILAELGSLPWRRTVTRYFPFEIPLWRANLCLGLQVRK